MNLILFFTYDTSLQDWKKSGLFEREVKLYKNIISTTNSKIYFITYGDESDLIYSNEIPEIEIIPIYKYIKKNKNSLIRMFNSIFIGYKLKKIINLKNSIIKTNQLWGSWVAIIYKLMTKKNKLIIRTGYDLLTFKQYQNKNFFKILLYFFLTYISIILCDCYTVTSRIDEIKLKKFFLVNKKKILFLPNWVEVKNHKNDNGNDNFVSVGRLEEQKNYEFLIKEFSNLDIGVDLIGEGSLRNHLKDKSRECNSKINFLGKFSNKEVLEKIQEYKYFILTSKYEGNPKTLLDAMSLGVIVIAPNIPNISEIIKHNENGILFNLKKNSLRNLVKILDTFDLSKIRKNAYGYIKTNHSLDYLTKKEISIYKNLLR